MKKIICFILAIMLVFSTAIVSSVFALSMLYGDVNEDNTVSIIDVTQIQYHIVGSHTLGVSQLILADVDRDASVNIVDATIIQRYLVKKVDSLPLVPTKVPNVKATALSDSEIQVSWSLISGAQKYWVYVNDVVYTSTTADSFIVSRRAPDTPYKIYVTAMVDNSVILSKDDADILTVTTLPDPDAPNIKDTASKISKLQSNTTLTLSLMADTHFECGQTEKLKAYEEFGKIQDHVNIDFAAN
ncbi:MAG: hypothetical protein IKB73_02615, partial [Ruminococcus sp.]|nr:hypothetical protein [Ruminococcus sp.]